ncbi:hypothetical protein ACQKK5_13330 [Brevibacillus panacihumi]|uniref:hypothetical protein n=1 Tax=Brevibacillus panacihumi TaxID=497735 RepID=UPI003CFE61E1
MTKFMMFFIAMGLVLVGCSNQDKANENNEKNTNSSANHAINTENTPSTEQSGLQDSAEDAAKNEGELSVQDTETAYEMCARALNDYYKAVWNGSVIELDAFIDNDNLKQYTQKKIESQYAVHVKNKQTDKVQNIEIGAWEVKYTDDVDGGFLYLKIPVQIHMDVGSYGEVTEFLVRNANGKLVIVDWYTGAKDSYDFTVRGENQTIDNPNIWNDSEWVKSVSFLTEM